MTSRAADIAEAILMALWKRLEMAPEALCAQVGISAGELRAGIEMLRERKCQIEATPTTVGLGTVGLACWQDILQGLAAERKGNVGRRVQVFARTGSTNDMAWRGARRGESDEGAGLVVLADEQSAGRGRFGHAWSAKAGQSILLSVLLENFAAGRGGSVDQLTLLAGLQAARGIEAGVLGATQGAMRVGIKWPNDLLVGGRKLAGVLVERRGSAVVVGIGINVGQREEDFPEAVRGRAISVYQATGAVVDRLRIAAAVLERMEDLGTLAGGNSGRWVEEWKSRCEMLGGRVTARCAGAVVSGLVTDVDPLEGLVIREDSGATRFLSAGSTSLGG